MWRSLKVVLICIDFVLDWGCFIADPDKQQFITLLLCRSCCLPLHTGTCCLQVMCWPLVSNTTPNQNIQSIPTINATARRKNYIMAGKLLLFHRGRESTRRLRGREADQAKVPLLLLLCSTVLRFLSSTEHHSDVICSHRFQPFFLHPKQTQQVAHWLTNYLVKGVEMTHPTMTEVWRIANQMQFNCILLRFFFVHICIQLYFLANLLSLHVGFI